jgi:iodotyrosine deiodinase
MTTARLAPLASYREYSPEETIHRAEAFRAEMQQRRSVRHFSGRPIPRQVIEECLLTAASAPSGANLQPWQFVVVSDPAVKRQIREQAEEQEREFYRQQSTQEWRDDLVSLGTDAHKPFLETAPYLIVVFSQRYRALPDGHRARNYYVTESVGIATGILLTAIHHAGLAALTYTPSRMGFLNRILDRPDNERPFLILVVGYPAENARVPELDKKPPRDVITFL